jgi:hypothetical protein
MPLDSAFGDVGHVTESETFKIDRSQRMHSGGVVVRVYQVIGSERFGWDTNRGELSASLHGSQAAAEQAADEAMQRAGHTCDDGC